MQKNINIVLNEITTVFFDVDGIFTDGSLYFSDNGSCITKFNVHDGMGCILLKEAGVELLILSARHGDEVVKRFKDLGIEKIYTKVLKKRDFIKEYSITYNLKKNELAMMGDDLQDLAAINDVGIFFSTPNAIDIVRDSSDYITKKLGGNGAVREICDLIIQSKGLNSSTEFEHYTKKVTKDANTRI
jgi:3-deoxy-D-manno-octulosonate 8-phosphate phosphatase (KDO 8-P phosphatase)